MNWDQWRLHPITIFCVASHKCCLRALFQMDAKCWLTLHHSSTHGHTLTMCARQSSSWVIAEQQTREALWFKYDQNSAVWNFDTFGGIRWREAEFVFRFLDIHSTSRASESLLMGALVTRVPSCIIDLR